MFAAIPFPFGQSRVPPAEAPPPLFPGTKKPASSFFGQQSAIPDLLVPPRRQAAPSSPEDHPDESEDLNRRKLGLTVETLEKQSHLLSLQIWHYERHYGLPHSEFSRRFDFGGASPIPPDHRGREEEGEKDAGEGASVEEREPPAEGDLVLKKENSVEEVDDSEEEGLCTDDSEKAAAPDTSFTNLFGQPSAGINFGSISQTNIFGGVPQINLQPPNPSINFSLPQVSQATKKTLDEESGKLTHRQLELTVETMQKQSHLLSLQILHYEKQHRIPHSEYSRMFTVDSALDGSSNSTGAVADPEPIDYTMTAGSE